MMRGTSVPSVLMFVGMGFYLLFMILIGLLYARRSNSDPEEYFLGKRKLGPWVTALSAEASDMSGWLLMGVPGLAYFTGMAEAFWTALGLALGTAINWHIVARRLRIYSQSTKSITLPAFFSNRFHDQKRILMTIAATVILIFFSVYTGAQFVTFGKFFSYVLGVKQYYPAMVIAGAVVLLVYTLTGGFLAVCMTDLIQGILMFCALLLVLTLSLVHSGGLSGFLERLADFPQFLSIFAIAVPADTAGNASSVQAVIEGVPQFTNGSPYSLLNIVSCLAWGLGYFGMPQVLIRFMAIQSPTKLRQSKYIAVLWCAISLSAAVVLGLLGRALFPVLLNTAVDAENIFIHLSIQFFPSLIAGLVLSGILAATMSSADSYMLAVSSSLANDLFKGIIRKDADKKAVLIVARVAILIVTIFGVIVALFEDSSIFRIVSYAWAGLGAAFGPLMLFSLFWKRTSLTAAIAGMLSGGIIVILWKSVISKIGGIFAVYELLPAFIISCLVIFVVSLLTPVPSAAIQREFERVTRKL